MTLILTYFKGYAYFVRLVIIGLLKVPLNSFLISWEGGKLKHIHVKQIFFTFNCLGAYNKGIAGTSYTKLNHFCNLNKRIGSTNLT